MEECLNGAKNLIYRQVEANKCTYEGEPFFGYQKMYYWTNENIDGTLNLVDLTNYSKALVVAASGDHAFNLITKGVIDIDTFDVNKLTEFYVLGLKIALINKYDYFEFLMIMERLSSPTITTHELTEIIYELLPYMDKKYYIFWKSIIDYNYKLQKERNSNINLINMLFIGINPPTDPILNNTYLLTEDNYNLFKYNLQKANITFKSANATELSKEFQGKYDIIMLSNILDYFYDFWGNNWTYGQLIEYEKSLSTITNKEGVIVLKYIMMYASLFTTRSTPFVGSNVTNNELMNEEIYKIRRNSGKNVKDGIILKRVK